MPNRSLQLKADKAKTQRVIAGINSSLNHLDRYTKRTLREVSAIASTMEPSRVCRTTLVERDYSETKLYNPRQPQARPTAAMAAQVDFEPFLIKR